MLAGNVEEKCRLNLRMVVSARKEARVTKEEWLAMGLQLFAASGADGFYDKREE
jgi:hypothetical protein